MMDRQPARIAPILALLMLSGLVTGCEQPSASLPTAEVAAPAEPMPQTTSPAAPEPAKVAPAAEAPQAEATASSPSAASKPVQVVPVSATKPGQHKEVTFDDIKLDLQKDEPYKPEKMTDKVKALSGQPIRIRGFIQPSYQNSGIRQFVLVRDNQECCFGPGAALHDCIIVEMVAPATTNFTTRPITVEGTFSIREVIFDGKYWAIYHLDGTKVD